MSASSAGEVDALHDHGELFRRIRQELDRLHRLRLQLQEARFDVGRRARLLRFGSRSLHARDEERPALEELERRGNGDWPCTTMWCAPSPPVM